MIDFSQCRVLIVDDVRANLDILVQALRDEYKLSVATSGEAALRSIEKTPPDLVLLDIMMPGMDGYEVCRRLRAKPDTREIPVMFLSALEDVKNKAAGFEAGGNDYLVKPFEVLEVKARVRSLLKAKAYSDAIREKLASELRIAKEIQLGILPADTSQSTAGAGIEVQTLIEPAREVGGDLYEVLRADDRRVVVILGDVSGKGIPAALFMAVTVTLLRTMARQFQHPDEILQQASDALSSQNPRNFFVTLFCAVFDVPTGVLEYASAGHPSPIFIRNGQLLSLPVDAAPVAGVIAGMPIERQAIPLVAGDRLILYTDGVTEAFNAAGDMFGETRLAEHFLQPHVQTGTLHDAVKGLLNAVRTHAGDHPQSDDIAIVALEKAPEEPR